MHVNVKRTVSGVGKDYKSAILGYRKTHDNQQRSRWHDGC